MEARGATLLPMRELILLTILSVMATFFMVKIKTRNIAAVMFMALLLLPSEMLTAATRSVEQARQLALRQMTKKGGDRAKGIGKADLKLVYTQDNMKAEPCYYVFATKPTEGFTIVSGDDRFPEIVGYTTNGDFDFNKMPPALTKMLEAYKTFSATATDEQIEEIRNVQAAMSGRANIEPMIKTKWDQPYPYNIYCPYMDNGQQTITGCVATAISQILYYHRCPEKLLADIPSYTTGSYQITMPEIKAGEKYDWDNMCLTYTGNETDAQKNAVARLMLHAGCAMEMDYGPESGAGVIPEKLVKYFGLDKDYIKSISRENYNLQDWSDIIYNELADKRPVIYDGLSSYGSGHSFIVDGYEEGLYSINWGWSGKNDGFFALTGLLDYNNDARMTIGICPENGKTDPNGNPNLSILKLEGIPVERIRNLRFEDGKLKATVELQLSNPYDSAVEVKVAIGYRGADEIISKASEETIITMTNFEEKIVDVELSFEAEEGKLYKLFSIESKDGDKWNVNEKDILLELPIVKLSDGTPTIVDLKEFISATAQIAGDCSGKFGEFNNIIVTLNNNAEIDYDGHIEIYLESVSSKLLHLNSCPISLPRNGNAKIVLNGYCAPKPGEYTILISKDSENIICTTKIMFTNQEEEKLSDNQGSPSEGWLWGLYRGNSMDDIREFVGAGGPGTYSAYIEVASDEIKDFKVKGMRLACTEDMGDVTFWIRRRTDEANLISKTVKSEKGKFIEAIFDQPCAVIPTMYCGYSFTSSSTPIFPTAGKEPSGWGLCRTDANGNWVWSVTKGGDHAIQLILEKDLPDAAVLAEWEDNSMIIKAGTKGLSKMVLTNNSKNKITNFDYIVDNGTSEEKGHMVLDKPLPAGVGVKGIVEIPFMASSIVSQNSYIDFRITKINGDEYSDNEAVRLNTITYSKEGTRRSLVEEYTATGCHSSPAGTAGMELLKNQFGDKAIILSLHQFNNDDPMWLDLEKYRDVSEKRFSSAAADRTDFHDLGFLPLYFEEINSRPTFADVIVAGYWNEDGSAVEAHADITSLTNELDISISFVLKADGLTGSDPIWAQKNAYAFDYPENYVDYPFYEGLKKFMIGGEYGEMSPIEGFVHDNVVIASSYKNSNTEVPPLTNISDGQTKRCSYTIPLNVNDILKKAIIPEKVSVVAILEDKDGKVINAAEALVKPCTTGISDTQADKVKVTKTYTIDGRETNGTVKGINIVKMSDGTVRKVMVK